MLPTLMSKVHQQELNTLLTGRPQAARVSGYTSSNNTAALSITMFLGKPVTEGLPWTDTTSPQAKKAQKHLNFLGRLRGARMRVLTVSSFYRGTTESILTSCITVWYEACIASCCRTIHPSLSEGSRDHCWNLSPNPSPTTHNPNPTHSSRLTRKSLGIAASQPLHCFFSLLPLRRRPQSLQGQDQKT